MLQLQKGLISLISCSLLTIAATTHVAAAPHVPVIKISYAPAYELGAVAGRIMGGLVPLAGVNVTLLQGDEVIAITTTNDEGFFHFRALNAGHYSLKTAKDGYRSHITTSVPVREDHLTIADCYMPQINNAHMPRTPITEVYEYKRKYVRELMREDCGIYWSKDLE